MAAQPSNAALAAALRQEQRHRQQLHDTVNELMQLQKARKDTPKWIEEMPGRRVPYFAPIDLNLAANSTSKVESVHNVSTDGMFIITAIMGFFKRTSGAYAGIWGPITAYDARIAETGQQHGYAFLFNQPNVISGDVEIIDRGSDRNWQDRPVASAAWSPQAGGAYILPASNLLGRNSTIQVTFTPGVAIAQTGTVQIVLAGYKIVQGDTYQP